MLSDLETSGGAARAACRLADCLRGAGIDVTRLVGVEKGERHDAVVVEPGRVERLGLRGLARLSKRASTQLHEQAVLRALDRHIDRARPDVINIHNLHYAGWSPRIASHCATRAPVVWTLHDMWSFTGRCAYAYDCRAFVSGCGSACPTADEYPVLPPHEIEGAWNRRARLVAASPGITIVAPSRWLSAEAARGLWRGHRIETIPYCVPLNTYRPSADRERVRHSLGLAKSSRLALSVPDNVTDRRKGFHLLVEALSGGTFPDLTLAVAGSWSEGIAIGGCEVRGLGYVTSEERMAELYAAADMLIHPAPVDNLPNVVLESIASGTPVLGFDIGGLPDMVRAGCTGWLAKETTAEALREAIGRALGDLDAGPDLRASCRLTAEQDYAPSVQAERYVDLFEELIQPQ